MRSRFWLVDKISGLVAVSIAAQLATFPLSLYYFHQFPVYFWLTNIIVIPLATLILYFGFLFFIFSFQPIIAGFIGKAQALLISGMNVSVETIREFPLSIIDGINISGADSIILYCIIIFTSLLLIRKKGAFFLPVLGSILFFLSINLYQLYGMLSQESAVIYNIKDVTAINFINGRKSYMVHDAGGKNMENQLNYYTENHMIASGIRKAEMFSLASVSEGKTVFCNNSLFLYQGFVSYHDLRFFIYSDNFQGVFNDSKKVNVDWLIYSNPDGMNISNLKKGIAFNKVIISSVIPEWKARLLQEECDRNNFSCYCIKNDGPCIFSFKKQNSF